jgi:beta-lactamase regulating signal transducer with metallopeptidase domain/uncharacterized membrane protein YkoI
MRTISQLLLTFLLNACWQIALVTAAAALCARLLRWTSARYQHLFWVTALAFSFSLPVMTSAPLLVGAFFSEPPRATVQPASGAFAPAPQLIPDTQASLPTAPPTALKEAAPFILISRNVAAVVVALYLLFLCYRGGKLSMAWRRARSLKRSAYPIELPEHVRTTVTECQTILGMRQVRVLCSTSIPVPIAVGSFNSLIILPDQLLRETDRGVLTAAIGHELIHVLRRDYLLNFIYEFISLPLSFHPATALVKRRIRETRELSCDELVAEKLLDAAVYARSLVRLAGSAVNLSRPGATITVGIADADILEERVMTILRRPKISSRRRSLLLVAAMLFFVVPCVAAAPFALRININSRTAAVTAQQDATPKGERARVEFLSPTPGVDMEIGALAAWLKKPGEAVERGEVIAEVKTHKGLVKAEAPTSGVIEKLLVQIGEKVPAGTALAIIRAQEQSASREVSLAQQEEQERRQLREETLKRKAAELEARRREEQQKLGFAITQEQEAKQKEAREREEKERAEREAKERDPEFIAHRKLEREAMARRQAELAKKANITMQQAIQIAMSQQAGTVMECRLIGERPAGEKDQVFYFLTIVSGDEQESASTRMLISAVDGRVAKTWKDEK